MTLTNLIACDAVLAYNMNTYDLEAPASRGPWVSASPP